MVRDGSECSSADLLEYTRPELKKIPQPHFEFERVDCAVLTALKDGQSVILKGNCSAELADSLAPILLKRQQQKELKGQLIVVSETGQYLEYCSDYSSHEVEEKDKQALLNIENASSPVDWSKPLSVIKASLLSPKGWDGLKILEQSIKPLAALNSVTSAKEIDLFNQQRKELILGALKHSPYVYIAGHSGVGKSTFVQKELLQATAHAFYAGEKNIEDWAKDQSDQLKLLFIDEANLSSRQWSEFEGLFNTPPGILINGIYHLLSLQHQVVFAGNPVSYGDERRLSPFFSRHGRAVVFNPLPLAVINEQILKPVFTNKPYAATASDICQPILEVYAFLCQLSTTEILISPRELQMMALLTASYCDQVPQAHPQKVAKHYAYETAKNLVPPREKAAFERVFNPGTQKIQPLLLPTLAKDTDFTITKSRQTTASLLNELLVLRQARRRDAVNDEQRYGGLGGLILEGEPGIGKSDLVMAVLRAHGLEKAKPDSNQAAFKPGTAFYLMNVSMSLTDKQALLLKAFDEGAVVVIDEINSSPMMEPLLNDLLMGKTPDKRRPHNPGFMVIGTQNPVTMAGRRAASTALSRRLSTIELPPYPRAEMLAILHKDLPDEDINLSRKLESMVDAFMLNVALAEKNHYAQVPNFRDLLRQAKGIKKHDADLAAVLQSEYSEPIQSPVTSATALKTGADSIKESNPEHNKPNNIPRDAEREKMWDSTLFSPIKKSGLQQSKELEKKQDNESNNDQIKPLY